MRVTAAYCIYRDSSPQLIESRFERCSLPSVERRLCDSNTHTDDPAGSGGTGCAGDHDASGGRTRNLNLKLKETTACLPLSESQGQPARGRWHRDGPCQHLQDAACGVG